MVVFSIGRGVFAASHLVAVVCGVELGVWDLVAVVWVVELGVWDLVAVVWVELGVWDIDA